MPFPDRLLWISRWASVCAVLAGSLALVGWAVGDDLLMRLGPGGVNIKPLTAAGFMALGVALGVMIRPDAVRASRHLVTALGAAGAVLGFLTLLEYVIEWDPGLDRLLAGSRVIAEHVKYPGRMLASTAFDLLLLGSAIAVAQVRPALVRTFQGLSLVAGFVALFAVICYLFDVVIDRPWMGDFTPMTPSTAVVFMGLSLGLLLTRANAGLMLYLTTPGPGGTMARTMLPIALVLPIILSWFQLVALRHAWESFEMIVTFRAMAVIVVLVSFIWISARTSYRQHEARVSQLQDAAEGLASANAELDGFARSVSHDLRAPVRAVDGFAQLLEENHAGQLDPEGRRLLGVVRESSRKMGQLIDDLLAFSRVSRQSRRTVRVAMQAMADEAANEACAAEPGRLIRVERGDLPDIDGDRSMLRQVWANLLSNAVKYTRRSAPALIRISAAVADGFVVYAVSDNGAGFDARYQDKLFGVFQRLHSADEYEGNGVGLALVKRIVERHGGVVGAEGRVGAGATFTFSLPLIPVGAAQA